MTEALTVEDTFINSWAELKADRASILLHWRDKLVRALADDLHDVAGMYKAMIVRFLVRKNKIFKYLNPAQINDIADDLKFIHEPWYDFHVTWIKSKLGAIYRPDEKLSSMTFWQLVKADAEYSKFLILNFREVSGQEHALDRLIAILYQSEPGKFDENDIEDYANALPKGLTFDLKYLILHTYSNCRKYIVNERCPTLFNAGASVPLVSNAEGPSETLEPAEPTYTGKMWQNMLFDLSETPAFSGLETAKNARIYDALDYLEKKSIDQENQKRK